MLAPPPEERQEADWICFVRHPAATRRPIRAGCRPPRRRAAAPPRRFGGSLGRFWRTSAGWGMSIIRLHQPLGEPAMKKIVIRKAGPVRLTTAACHVYPNA